MVGALSDEGVENGLKQNIRDNMHGEVCTGHRSCSFVGRMIGEMINHIAWFLFFSTQFTGKILHLRWYGRIRITPSRRRRIAELWSLDGEDGGTSGSTKGTRGFVKEGMLLYPICLMNINGARKEPPRPQAGMMVLCGRQGGRCGMERRREGTLMKKHRCGERIIQRSGATLGRVGFDVVIKGRI